MMIYYGVAKENPYRVYLKITSDLDTLAPDVCHTGTIDDPKLEALIESARVANICLDFPDVFAESEND